MSSLTTFPQPTFLKDFEAHNQFGLDPVTLKAIVQLAASISSSTVFTASALTDAASIATDASLGSDYYVTLAGNRTMSAPTNPVAGKTIRYWITQDATGSRTLAWNAIFRFSTGLPSPTLTTTANFMDMAEFEYNPYYLTWDCIRIVKGFDATP